MRRECVGASVGHLNLFRRYLRELPMSPRLPAVRQQLEAQDLERKRKQIFQPVKVPVLLMQQDQHFLRQILGGVPLYSRCREAYDPFPQLAQHLLARARRLVQTLGGR